MVRYWCIEVSRRQRIILTSSILRGHLVCKSQRGGRVAMIKGNAPPHWLYFFPFATRMRNEKRNIPSTNEPSLYHTILADPMAQPRGDFSPAADEVPGQNPPSPQPEQTSESLPHQPSATAAPSRRALNPSKKAQQNRIAVKAFRKRRDDHMKALELRSAQLDVALASAEEAMRGYEECRALADKLRVENAKLRAVLGQRARLLQRGAYASNYGGGSLANALG
ncbi:hypothetical protein FB45DRAFT_900641 [Roridomyces roridus]|uniref:BZIP domain-containing protein n=1 Tax=Roridomyces roridus TaxID=1738132 RepID=A0AAD7C884_9AGAR|nr:hypothetical protein FB45DRAFT_900641 [Roridomyces roridus]